MWIPPGLNHRFFFNYYFRGLDVLASKHFFLQVPRGDLDVLGLKSCLHDIINEAVKSGVPISLPAKPSTSAQTFGSTSLPGPIPTPSSAAAQFIVAPLPKKAVATAAPAKHQARSNSARAVPSPPKETARKKSQMPSAKKAQRFENVMLNFDDIPEPWTNHGRLIEDGCWFVTAKYTLGSIASYLAYKFLFSPCVARTLCFLQTFFWDQIQMPFFQLPLVQTLYYLVFGTLVVPSEIILACTPIARAGSWNQGLIVRQIHGMNTTLIS